MGLRARRFEYLARHASTVLKSLVYMEVTIGGDTVQAARPYCPSQPNRTAAGMSDSAYGSKMGSAGASSKDL